MLSDQVSHSENVTGVQKREDFFQLEEKVMMLPWK